MKEIIFRVITSACLIIILYTSYKYNNFFFVLLGILFALSLYEYSNLIFKIEKKRAKRTFYITLATFYIVFVIFFIFLNFSEIKNILYYFIIICISSDIGGLIVGKILKGKKLTKISPNKTVSGFFGSFVFSFLLMISLFDYMTVTSLILYIFTFSVCLLSQIGDIFFSYLKRLAKVKDTGKILPGHGGILDRIDGIIISVPINILIYTISL